MTRQEIIDACAEAAHEAWLAEKLRRMEAMTKAERRTFAGLIISLGNRIYASDCAEPVTWLSETGEEQLVPWATLSESGRDFDRIVVAAIIDVMVDKGVIGL